MQNTILMTDSYKYSHKVQYPEGTEYVSSYIEARGGAKESVFFGLQAFLKEYLLTPITKEMVDEAESLVTAHGEPFYREGWDIIVSEMGGRLPIEIEAVPEGTVMPTQNAQVQITNTDPRFFWLPSFLETTILRAVWYPSTVATKSREVKKIITWGLERTSDVPVADQIGFKLHDFGARGASSPETATLGGMGHLLNFMGTDTFEAVVGAKRYYGEPMAGFSIPASEHSTITSWGRENEAEAFENMLDQFAKPGAILACVSDSYNIYEALDKWADLKDKIIASGATLVVRPDSGDPLTVPIEVIEGLMYRFGYETNSKGFKVLPPYIRVIQGDGINLESLWNIITSMVGRGLSIDNIAFGMGGGLLQAWDRDTLKYAMKASAIMMEGEAFWRDVYKDPVHGGKTSKKGRLGVMVQCGVGSCGIRTVPKSVADDPRNIGEKNMMQVVYRNGELLVDQTFAEIRERAAL
jgi:nicotinamide phosphoribosyltransferase